MTGYGFADKKNDDLIISISDGIEQTSKNFTIKVTDQAVDVNYYATPQSDTEKILSLIHI